MTSLIANMVSYSYYLALQAMGSIPKITVTRFDSKDVEIDVCSICGCYTCSHTNITLVKKITRVTERVKTTRDQTYEEYFA